MHLENVCTRVNKNINKNKKTFKSYLSKVKTLKYPATPVYFIVIHTCIFSLDLQDDKA